MYLVFTRIPGESYRRRLRPLLQCLCDVFRALINSLVRCSCCFFLTFCSDLGQELLMLISLFVLTLDENSCCQRFSFFLDFRQTSTFCSDFSQTSTFPCPFSNFGPDFAQKLLLLIFFLCAECRQKRPVGEDADGKDRCPSWRVLHASPP